MSVDNSQLRTGLQQGESYTRTAVSNIQNSLNRVGLGGFHGLTRGFTALGAIIAGLGYKLNEFGKQALMARNNSIRFGGSASQMYAWSKMFNVMGEDGEEAFTVLQRGFRNLMISPGHVAGIETRLGLKSGTLTAKDELNSIMTIVQNLSHAGTDFQQNKLLGDVFQLRGATASLGHLIQANASILSETESTMTRMGVSEEVLLEYARDEVKWNEANRNLTIAEFGILRNLLPVWEKITAMLTGAIDKTNDWYQRTGPIGKAFGNIGIGVIGVGAVLIKIMGTCGGVVTTVATWLLLQKGINRELSQTSSMAKHIELLNDKYNFSHMAKSPLSEMMSSSQDMRESSFHGGISRTMTMGPWSTAATGEMATMNYGEKPIGMFKKLFQSIKAASNATGGLTGKIVFLFTMMGTGLKMAWVGFVGLLNAIWGCVVASASFIAAWAVPVLAVITALTVVEMIIRGILRLLGFKISWNPFAGQLMGHGFDMMMGDHRKESESHLGVNRAGQKLSWDSNFEHGTGSNASEPAMSMGQGVGNGAGFGDREMLNYIKANAEASIGMLRIMRQSAGGIRGAAY